MAVWLRETSSAAIFRMGRGHLNWLGYRLRVVLLRETVPES